MAEAPERYSVLIVGIDGIEGGPAAAIGRLEAKFKLPHEVATRLVESIPAVVKKSVTMGEAQRYASALRSIGAESRIVPFSTETADKAAVTGILRKRTAARPDRATAREGVRTSGGYTMVMRRRDGSSSTEDEIVTRSGSLGDLDGFLDGLDDGLDDGMDAAPAAAPSEVEPGDATRIGPGALGVERGATMRFDPSAFALPEGIGSGSHDPAGAPSADTGPAPSASRPPDAGVAGAGGSASPAKRGDAAGDLGERPSLFDELMSLGEESSEPARFRDVIEHSGAIAAVSNMPSGDFSTTGSGSHAMPSFSLDDLPPEPQRNEQSASLTGVGKLSDFGTLDLFNTEESAPRLELDTTKPHLTGRHAAVGGMGELPDAAPPKVRPTIAMSGLTEGLDPRESSRSLRTDDRDPGGTHSRSGASPRLARGAEAAADSGASLRSSGAARRSATSDTPAIVGGFDARRERSRKSTQRAVRVLVTLILLVIVAVAGASGVYFYLQHASMLPAKRFSAATTYYEHHVRLPGGDAVRACALVTAEHGFVCRYSRDWYANWFPDAPAGVLERAPGACYGQLIEDGRALREVLDCTLPGDAADGGDKLRMFYGNWRECDASLLELEPGGTARCRIGSASRMLDVRAEAPAPELGVTAEFQYRRNVELNTDVGTMTSREFLVRAPGSTDEYRYFAPSVGLFVRRAELAGAAVLRLTYFEQDGVTSGTQVWAR